MLEPEFVPMLGFKLIHICKRDPRQHFPDLLATCLFIAMLRQIQEDRHIVKMGYTFENCLFWFLIGLLNPIDVADPYIFTVKLVDAE